MSPAALHPLRLGMKEQGAEEAVVAPPALTRGLKVCSSTLGQECMENSSSAQRAISARALAWGALHVFGSLPLSKESPGFQAALRLEALSQALSADLQAFPLYPHVGSGLNHKVLG